MYDRVGKVSNSGDKLSGNSSNSYQSSWVSRWTQTPTKQRFLIDPHSSALYCEKDTHQHSKQRNLLSGMSSGTPKSCSDGGNKLEAHSLGLLRERGKNLVVEKSDCEAFHSFSHATGKSKALASEKITLLDAGNSNFGRMDELPRTFGCSSPSRLSLERKSLAPLKSSRDNVSSLAASGAHPNKFGVFERHLTGNTSTGLNRRDNKIENYSAMLVREKETDHLGVPATTQKNKWDFLQRDIQPINSFKPLAGNQNQFLNMEEDPNQELLFRRRTCPPRSSSYYGKPVEVSNVETMRICTTFDTVKNSQGGHPTFAHTTHQFLYTKQTGFNLPRHEMFQEAKGSTQRKHGVSIQPLWSSTDDSEEKGGAINETSAETKTADMVVCGNKNDVSGVASSKLNVETPRKETVIGTNTVLGRDKVWGKLPIIQTTNVNKELIGFRGELRSFEGIDPAASQQTQSLEAEQLFFDAEDSPTRSKSRRPQNLVPLLEPSSRSIKRLKTSSSMSLELGIKGSKLDASTSSHEKKTNLNLNLNLFRGSSQKAESSLSSNKIQNTVLPWIKRWRVNPSLVTPRDKSQAVVICEPNTTKLRFDELGRKQFPSIGAMALMGRSMNGLRPCELTKKGPLVVWNTKSY